MNTARQSRHRAAWLLLIAIAVGGVGFSYLLRVARLQRRGAGSVAVPPASPAAPRPLRVESIPGSAAAQAPRPLRTPRVESKTAPSVREAKPVVPLAESPAARETTPPEQRTPGSTRKSILLSREEVLKERDGVYGFATRAYGATVGQGKVEVALPLILKESGQPRLTYDFVELRAGDVPLASGGPARARAVPEERTVSYDRGPVEERYILRSLGSSAEGCCGIERRSPEHCWCTMPGY